MSANYFVRKLEFNLGTLDASGSNSVVFAPAKTQHVHRIVLVTTVAQTVANATITVAVRDVDNGNSTTKGSFVLPFSGSATDDVQFVDLGLAPTTAESSGYVVDQNVPGRTAAVVYKSGTGYIEVKPGQELVLSSDGGGDAGTYQVYLLSWDQDFREKVGSPTKTKRTFTPA